MGESPIRWLGSDIQIEDRRFCHGDNGVQEFYETVIAAKGVLLGILCNHGEGIWIAYVTQGQAVRTLTGCSHRADTCTPWHLRSRQGKCASPTGASVASSTLSRSTAHRTIRKRLLKDWFACGMNTANES